MKTYDFRFKKTYLLKKSEFSFLGFQEVQILVVLKVFFTCVMIFNYVEIAICGVRMAESLFLRCNFVSGICKLKSKKT